MIAPLAIALTLAASTAAKAPAVKAPVALTFAWPDDVEATRTERMDAMGPAVGSRSTETAHLRSVHAGDEWRVVVGTLLDGEDARPLTLVAGADGGLRRLEGTGDFRAGVLAEMRRRSLILSLIPSMREAQEKLVSGLLDLERERWAQDVARWAGKTLVPGETREEVRPAADARSLPVWVRHGLRRHLPCPDDASRTCVELWATEEPDDAARRRACAGGDPFENSGLVAVSSELVVIAEPGTLQPHRSTGRSTSRNACEGGFMLGDSTASHERAYAWRSR